MEIDDNSFTIIVSNLKDIGLISSAMGTNNTLSVSINKAAKWALEASKNAKPTNPSSNLAFTSGSWDAFNQVLNWINTWPEQTLDKSKLYEKIMEMRPSKPNISK